MFAIRVEVEEVVENVESGGAKAIKRKANQSVYNGPNRQIVGESKREKEQKILCPVMAAKGVGPSSKRCTERCTRFEDRAVNRGDAGSLRSARFGAHDVGCPGVPPHFYIGGGVAHVVIASLGEVLGQKSSLVCSLQIYLSV